MISLYHQSFDRKKDRTNRSILNLEQINEDADPILVHFKMDSLKSAIHPLKQNSWFASIKDAFCSLPVSCEDRKYGSFGM